MLVSSMSSSNENATIADIATEEATAAKTVAIKMPLLILPPVVLKLTAGPRK